MLTFILAGCAPADVVLKEEGGDSGGLAQDSSPPTESTPTSSPTDTSATHLTTPPPHRAIATSRYGSCLVTADGGLWCWGGIVDGETDYAATWFERATHVEGLIDVAGFTFSRAQACAAFQDGNVRCWDHRGWDASGGRLRYTAEGSISLGPAARVAVGDHRIAWVEEGGRVRVVDGLGDPDTTARTLTEDAVDVAVSETGDVCALLRDGRLVCSDPDLSAVPSGTRLRAVAVGGGAACGVEDDGDGVCWSREGTDHWTFGDAVAVSMSGDDTGCWRRAGGQVEWWDARAGSVQVAGPPALAAASCTSLHGCGIGVDGGAWCWGVDDGALGGEPDANGVAAVQIGG